MGCAPKPTSQTHTDVDEEVYDSAGEILVCLNDQRHKHQTPYSEQNEEQRDEEELELHALHRGLPVLSQDGPVPLYLEGGTHNQS